MHEQALIETARALVASGKGILAADESTGTIAKRLSSINVECSEANRQTYRNLLFTTEGAEKFISGVIMFEETLFQKSNDGTPFPDLLAAKGIIPGVKVDKGAKPLVGCDDETVTEGLDGLRERLAQFYEAGARFAKWRAVIRIGEDIPTDNCLATNAHALARYAALCQEAGIVPVVEPEVLMDGGHSIEECEAVTEATLNWVFAELAAQGVLFEGMLLKPNMVISGTECDEQADVATVAAATLRCLKRTVPAAVPGIVFLSGGQSDEVASAHLNAMNELGDAPWRLSFSYGRALQASALATWVGKQENVKAAQQALYLRAKCNSAAAQGKYSADMEAIA